jgi:hypothetical protein
MSYVGGDFGFVGASYTAPDPYQDRQRTLNYYPEISQDDKSKTPTALLGCPGLSTVLDFDTPINGVRGAWVLPGGNSCVFVVGDTAYLATVTVPATQTSIAQFSFTQIGNLLTNVGPVCIRDNGPGGYVVLVDGPYGYLYNIATQVFAQITDPAFLGADRVAFIDGWLIFNEPGTQNFYTNASVPYTVTFAGSFFAKKDSSSDNLITLMENNRELWLIGERTSEVWYDAGGANFAFSRIPGVAPQIGCSAVNSIARLGSSLVWLASNEQGQNIVVMTNQYSYEIISDQAAAAAIASYPLISDAIGFAYEEDDHQFYVLTFPTADKTWVFDVATKKWHERASFDPATGEFHRFKGNCFVNFQNIRMVGDYQSPLVYQMSRQIFVDGETPLVALRRAPHIWSRENRKRLFHASLQIEFAPGVGLQTGQGVNPQAMLRWSDDGGATFGNQHWTTIGAVGQYKNRAMWRRLGHARDRVYEMSISDPVRRDIVGATLFAQGEQEAAA